MVELLEVSDSPPDLIVEHCNVDQAQSSSNRGAGLEFGMALLTLLSLKASKLRQNLRVKWRNECRTRRNSAGTTDVQQIPIHLDESRINCIDCTTNLTKKQWPEPAEYVASVTCPGWYQEPR